jgi:hypothetical protein
MNNRLCVCGCIHEKHVEKFNDVLAMTRYCRDCIKSGKYCLNYRPISNLEYLEWLYEEYIK